MKDLQGFGESAPLGGCDCFKFDLWIKPDSTAISDFFHFDIFTAAVCAVKKRGSRRAAFSAVFEIHSVNSFVFF